MAWKDLRSAIGAGTALGFYALLLPHVVFLNPQKVVLNEGVVTGSALFSGNSPAPTSDQTAGPLRADC